MASSSKKDFALLIASDGFQFVLPLKAAMGSTMIRDTLNLDGDDGNFVEADTQTIRLAYRGIIVSKIVEYLVYKAQYADVQTKDVQEDFSERIEPELALEL